MVACPSAKWVTAKDKQDPSLPVMSRETVTGIVAECFHSRRYFLRQLFQSLPAVLLVLSRATADAFLAAMSHNLSGEIPKVDEDASAWLHKRTFLNYGKLPTGTPLSARVIFAPHATGDPTHFEELRGKIVAALVEEASAKRILLNRKTGHCI
jgi:hypothetical protein